MSKSLIRCHSLANSRRIHLPVLLRWHVFPNILAVRVSMRVYSLWLWQFAEVVFSYVLPKLRSNRLEIAQSHSAKKLLFFVNLHFYVFFNILYHYLNDIGPLIYLLHRNCQFRNRISDVFAEFAIPFQRFFHTFQTVFGRFENRCVFMAFMQQNRTIVTGDLENSFTKWLHRIQKGKSHTYLIACGTIQFQLLRWMNKTLQWHPVQLRWFLILL